MGHWKRKWAGRLALKVERLFDGIPAELGRHEKKFRPTALSPNARLRDYEDAFVWLSDAMLVNVCYNATDPDVGLRMNADAATRKCYFGDTGLLVSHAFDEQLDTPFVLHPGDVREKDGIVYLPLYMASFL